VDLFVGHGVPKASQEPEEIPCEGSGRDPLGDGACGDSEWPECLKVCVDAYGGHFERHYYKRKPKTIGNKLFGSKSGCFV